MATISAVPGVSWKSASSAQRVSQDLVGGRAWNKSNGLGDRNSVTGSGGSGGSVSSNNWQSLLNQYQAMIQANVQANNEFNAQQAQLNRNWQEKMSNTAHQREVADLKAAGLNPVLSAMNGNGAATTSGATASADTSGNSALVGLLGSLVQGYVSMENQRVSAQNNLAVAEKYNQMSKYTAELSSATNLAINKRQVETQIALGKLNAQTALSTANISAMTSRFVAQLQANTSLSVAQINKAATIVSAQLHSAATRYAADKSYTSSIVTTRMNNLSAQNVAGINAQVNRELNQANIDAKFDFAEMYPMNEWQYNPDQANIREWLDSVTGGLRDLGIAGSGLADFGSSLISGKGISSAFKFGPFGSGF